MENTVIAIDGPAGSGKSTIAKIIADMLGYIYIDTGAMYRALTYKAVKMNVDAADENEIINMIKSSDIDFSDGKIMLDGEDISEQIRMPIVNERVSKVASIKDVRLKMVDLQRKIAGRHNVVMDGRDIGTHVFPDAKYKFYMEADIEERAKRRHLEMSEKGYDVDLSSVIEDLSERDRQDKNREFAPLAKAEDAIAIDTTQKNIEQVTQDILHYIRRGEKNEN